MRFEAKWKAGGEATNAREGSSISAPLPGGSVGQEVAPQGRTVYEDLVDRLLSRMERTEVARD